MRSASRRKRRRGEGLSERKGEVGREVAGRQVAREHQLAARVQGDAVTFAEAVRGIVAL